jgi:DNA-binding MarR family transcriptional regulator
VTPDDVDGLRVATQRFLRSFGALAADATPCGKPLPIAHAHALMVLLARGELSQQDLGLELNIDKSNVTRLCAKMVETGHVLQKPHARDGRSRIIVLSTRGKRLAQEVTAASHARFGAVLNALPTERRSHVISALHDLVSAVETSFPHRHEKGAAE